MPITLHNERRMLELIVKLYLHNQMPLYIDYMHGVRVLAFWLGDSHAYLPCSELRKWPTVAEAESVPSICTCCQRKVFSTGGRLIVGCPECGKFADMYSYPADRIAVLTGFHVRQVELEFCRALSASGGGYGS